MLLDHLVLVGRQRTRLAEDLVGDADLADVVEEAGEVDRPGEVGLDADPLGEEGGVAGDVLGMPLRVAILRVDGEDEAVEDVEATGGDRRLVRRAGQADRVAAARLSLFEGAGRRREQDGDRRAVVRIRAQAGADGDRQPLGRLELETPVGKAVRSRSMVGSSRPIAVAGAMRRNSSGP